MHNSNITQLSATDLNKSFLEGNLTATEIIHAFLDRIEKMNDDLNAFTQVFKDESILKAQELDLRRSKGDKLGRLAGVPIGIKDNIHFKGHLTTCASSFLTNFKSPYNASVVDLLLQEDAIIIGKLNLDEFAMGSTTEHSCFGPSKNPLDLHCTAGGSSGGSASAVAARLCPIALGSDTGGSIRQPASFCGIYGLKPTYGRVSRYGLVAFASSFDQIGPLAHDITDIARVMEIIGKPCSKDSTVLDTPSHDYSLDQKQDLSHCRIGVPYHFLKDLSDEAKAAFQDHLNACTQLGATLVEVDLDILHYSIAVYYIIACSEAATNLARFDGIRYGHRSKKAHTLEDIYQLSKEEGFGYEVKRRMLLGNFCLSSDQQEAFFGKAQKVRRLISESYLKAFKKCDLVAMPTTPTPAYPIGSMLDPISTYLGDIYTSSVNLAGLPAISIPSNSQEGQLPRGFQLVSSQLQEVELYQAASLIGSLLNHNESLSKN